jgi:hypothetical protein
MNLLKYEAKLYAWLARRDNARSHWKGIEAQRQLAENISMWAKTDNYTPVPKSKEHQ